MPVLCIFLLEFYASNHKQIKPKKYNGMVVKIFIQKFIINQSTRFGTRFN